MAMRATTLLRLGIAALACSISASADVKPTLSRTSVLHGSALPRSELLHLRGGGCFGGVQEEKNVQLSVEVASSGRVPGEGRPRRSAKFPQLVSLPLANNLELNTPYAALTHTATRFPTRPCLGTRARDAEGALGEYEWKSYKEVKERVEKLGTALKQECGVGKGSMVGIYAGNREEWTMSMLAIWSQGGVLVPLFDSVGPTAVQHVLKHAEVTTVICEKNKLPSLLLACKDTPSVQHVILMDSVHVLDQEIHDLASCTIPMTDLEALTSKVTGEAAANPHAPEDLCTILYTSGTTGEPKGVMLSAQNLLASVAGCLNLDPSFDGLDTLTSDYFDHATYISYLPLAHSFELNMQILMITCGAKIGFFGGDIKKLVAQDLPVLRPTIMPGVPAVYGRIWDKIVTTVKKKGAWQSFLFERGLAANRKRAESGSTSRSCIYDWLCFSKLKRIMGGRVKLFLTGAAPMDPTLQSALSLTFDCPVVQGYGMTENAGAALAMEPSKGGEVEPGAHGKCGAPLPCSEVKLLDVPEMDYTTRDRYPETAEAFASDASFRGRYDPRLVGKAMPRGEVCLRGPNIMMGYYKQEEETAKVIDDDGWLHTGDIGQWNADGSLTILDRKNNIFRIKDGDYVSVEAVEEVVLRSRFVSQCWVYGSPFHSSLVAVLVPDKEAVTEFCESNGIEGDFATMCGNGKVYKAMKADIEAAALAERLPPHEVPKAFHLEINVNSMGQAFTVENECLTPSFKLRRQQLLKKYQAQVDALLVDGVLFSVSGRV